MGFFGLFVGLFIGVFFPVYANYLKPFRALFLNAIKCVIAPLVFSTLVNGIAGIGSVKQLGRLGLRCLIYFELVTTIALIFGLMAVNILKPGYGLLIIAAPVDPAVMGAQMTMGQFIEKLIPTNIAQAIIDGDILQIAVFSVLFAICDFACR